MDCGETFVIQAATGRPPSRCRQCKRRSDTARTRQWLTADPARIDAAYCRVNARNRERVRIDPKFRAARRRWQLKAKYGLSPDEWQRMYDAQNGRCGICGQEPSGKRSALFVDHCHETGHVRGLLCNRCNVLLGMAQNDPAVLSRAAEWMTARSTQ